MLADQKYKLERLADIPEDGVITMYKCGDFVDLCRGPHVERTSQIGAFKLVSVAGSYYRGKETNPMLQRIYGIAFPSKQELKEYLQRIEEAKKRDHRNGRSRTRSVASARRAHPQHHRNVLARPAYDARL